MIVRVGDFVQAQVVDGGSGMANQHDLDLSFGLGESFASKAEVEIIWPCGQIQHETLALDEYHTVTLEWPEVVRRSVRGYLEWTPGYSNQAWVFEWKTSGPSDISLDEIGFPNGVSDGGTMVYSLDEARSDVDYRVSRLYPDQYLHQLKWLGRSCSDQMTVPFVVHSRTLDKEFTQNGQLLVIQCPVSN